MGYQQSTWGRSDTRGRGLCPNPTPSSWTSSVPDASISAPSSHTHRLWCCVLDVRQCCVSRQGERPDWWKAPASGRSQSTKFRTELDVDRGGQFALLLTTNKLKYIEMLYWQLSIAVYEMFECIRLQNLGAQTDIVHVK